jgi:DNA-directed RNA polymerase subunit beta'
MFKKYCFKNISFNKRELKDLVGQYYIKYGISKASCLLDSLKDLGFYFATHASISLAVEDLKVPPIKKSLINTTNVNINLTNLKYLRGNITNVERFQKVIDTWNQTNDDLKTEVVKHFKRNDSLNPIYLMAFSGARGNVSQVHQLVGMRGLMADPNGQIIDIPIEANFREGLKITDYIISSYGARKGIVDTALKTADSGYLTRRLVDVAQHVIIREIDCNTQMGIFIKESSVTSSNLIGRLLINNISKNNELILRNTNEITLSFINLSKDSLISDIVIKSPLTCISSRSICQKCYGWNLSQINLVEIGEAVGIIAAQSIGEPGTQLTMRTFHTGGVFSNTSKKQIRSKYNGKVIFSHLLNLNASRTIYGEEIFIVENFSQFYFVKKDKNVVKCIVFPNMMLFVRNKQNVAINHLIAEIPLVAKQFIEDTKNITADLSGEIRYQNLRVEIFRTKQIKITKEGVLWIISGNILNVPKNAILNLKNFSTVIKNNGLVSLKILNKTKGIVKIKGGSAFYSEDRKHFVVLKCFLVFEFIMIFKNKLDRLTNFYFLTKNNLLFKFDFNIISSDSDSKQIAKQVNYSYTLKIEGKIFKSFPAKEKFKNKLSLDMGSTIIISPLEHYSVNRDINVCLVSQNSYIAKRTELIPDLFSKNEGLVQITKLDNILTNIFIYYGKLGNLICLNKHFYSNFLGGECFYPGEILFNSLEICILTKIDTTNIIFSQKNKNFDDLNKFCKYELFCQPLIQCVITKTQLYTKNLTTANISHSSFELQRNLLVQHNEIFSFDAAKKIPLVSSDLKVKFNNKNFSNKFQVLYFSNKLNPSFIQMYFYVAENIFLSKDIFSTSKSNQITLNSVIKNNQFVEPYSILATIHILSDKLKYIKQRKRNKFKSNQLIYSVVSSYCDKMGLNTKSLKQDGLFLKQIVSNFKENRIGQPYFISKGTLMYVNHGDFIQKNKLICLLVYEKIISGDIIQGLPKIEQILESRISKLATKLVNEPGLLVKIKSSLTPKVLILTKTNFNYYWLKSTKSTELQVGNILSIGQPLEIGSVNPHLLLNVYFEYYKSLFTQYEATYRSFINIQILLVNSVQNVYKSQGVTISDKHIEVIIKQMSSKVQILATNFSSKILPGTVLPIQQVNYINFALKLEGQPILSYRPILFGITRTSLATESFLSAASFQETTKILTQAAMEGKIDWLRGLKENVIMGKLMPSGTGFTVFNPLNSLYLQKM